MTLRIMLVDDNAQYRQALKMLLELQDGMQVVSELSDGDGIPDAVQQSNANLVLMDICMQAQDGRDITRLLLQRKPELKIIGLSAHADPSYAADMIKAGALGYVVKGGAISELLSAIQTVGKGCTYIDPFSKMK